jgi:hypothetical protein
VVESFQKVLDLCPEQSVVTLYFSTKEEHRTATPPKRLCFQATLGHSGFQELLKKSKSIVMFEGLKGF